jgi:hypothetical protein
MRVETLELSSAHDAAMRRELTFEDRYSDRLGLEVGSSSRETVNARCGSELGQCANSLDHALASRFSHALSVHKITDGSLLFLSCGC